jgi:hypothetical protein
VLRDACAEHRVDAESMHGLAIHRKLRQLRKSGAVARNGPT